MTLDEYLRTEKISGTSFAERVGTSGASINRIRHGKQAPSPDMMARIIAASGGKVTLEALVYPARRAA